MLDNDAFVFDCVCHVFNFDMNNAYGKPGQMFINHLYAFHQVLTPLGERVLGPEEFLREWSIDEIAQMVFEESGTDMIVAQPLPLTDLFYDGLSQWEKCAAMAQKYPDRAIFWGSINPLVTTIGVHKGVPLGPQPIEHTQAWDMDGAAANFPDINFVIFHVGLPFIDEICWQLVRYPNLYASIAATLNFIVRAPRAFAENMGKLMFWCGEDKILYGGETPIWHPRWALDAFWKFELPEDLVTGYGYPQLTTQAKKKILGGNLARLMGIDVEQKVAALRG